MTVEEVNRTVSMAVASNFQSYGQQIVYIYNCS